MTDLGGNVDFDPMLDPNGLASNGGFADTIALLPGSPCFGAGTANGAPQTDERGVIRPSPPSIGAYDGGVLPKVPAPIISPNGAAATAPQPVTLTDTLATASIYYTLDGSTPTQASTLYDGTPIIVSSSETVSAIAAAPGYAPSVRPSAAGGSRDTFLVVNAVSGVASAKFIITPPDTHTYPSGLAIISAPDDYSNLVDDSDYSLANIFSQSGIKLAVWDPTSSVYAITPTPLANTLVPGKGYWVRFTASTSLLGSGVPTDSTVPSVVTLAAGWNLIGSPSYLVAIASIDVASGPIGGSEPFANAVSGGVVNGTLYAYQATDTLYEAVNPATDSLSPHLGYWLYAFQPCSLIYPPAAITASALISAANGGTIVNGRNTLTIPAHALAQGHHNFADNWYQHSDTHKRGRNTSYRRRYRDGPKTGAMVIGTGVDIEPSGLQLSKPATLSIDFDATNVPKRIRW